MPIAHFILLCVFFCCFSLKSSVWLTLAMKTSGMPGHLNLHAGDLDGTPHNYTKHLTKFNRNNDRPLRRIFFFFKFANHQQLEHFLLKISGWNENGICSVIHLVRCCFRRKDRGRVGYATNVPSTAQNTNKIKYSYKIIWRYRRIAESRMSVFPMA